MVWRADELNSILARMLLPRLTHLLTRPSVARGSTDGRQMRSLDIAKPEPQLIGRHRAYQPSPAIHDRQLLSLRRDAG